ncbi:MAG: hypothetical protein WBM44_27290 [Waterburya sp.]
MVQQSGMAIARSLQSNSGDLAIASQQKPVSRIRLAFTEYGNGGTRTLMGRGTTRA